MVMIEENPTSLMMKESRRGLMTEDGKSHRSRSSRGLDKKRSSRRLEKRRSSRGFERDMDHNPSSSRSLDDMRDSIPKQPRVHKTITCTHEADKKKEEIYEFKQLKEDNTLNDVIIENLLCSSVSSSSDSPTKNKANTSTSDKLMAKAKDSIIKATDRQWYRLMLRDSFDFTRPAFGKWMNQKTTMMVDFEAAGMNKEDSALHGIIQWQIHVTLPETTLADDIYQLIKIVKDDPSVLDVKLSIPKAKALIPMIDWNDSRPKLKQPLMMVLECGWSKKESLVSYKKLLIACLTLLKNAKRQHTEGASAPMIERSLNSMSSFRSSANSLGSAEFRASVASSKGGEVDTRAFGSSGDKNATWDNTKKEVRSAAEEPSSPKEKANTKKIGAASRSKSPKKTKKSIRIAEEEANDDKKEASATIKPDEPQRQQSSKKCCWGTAVDATTNDTYYYHRTTMEVSWDKPKELVEWEARNRRQ